MIAKCSVWQISWTNEVGFFSLGVKLSVCREVNRTCFSFAGGGRSCFILWTGAIGRWARWSMCRTIGVTIRRWRRTAAIRTTKSKRWKTQSFFTLLSHLLFSFLVDFFSLPSVPFPRESFEVWLPVLWLLLLPFSAFFNVWLEICRPGRNLFVVDEGDTSFLLPLDFLSPPFFTALGEKQKIDQHIGFGVNGSRGEKRMS